MEAKHTKCAKWGTRSKRILLGVKKEPYKFTALAVWMLFAASGANLAAENNDSWRGALVPGFAEHQAPEKVVEILAFGDMAMQRTIETQTAFIRHEATEAQIRAAERNAKLYYARLAPEKKAALKKKKIHYLAVPTVRSKETSPKAKEVIMIWDIPRETLVGKNVYELDSVPSTGKLASFDNIAAEYIGKTSKTP